MQICKQAQGMQFGWNPQAPDYRDYKFTAPLKALPKSTNRLTTSLPIYDQQRLGACVSCGCARLWQHRRLMERQGCSMASRLFIYYQGRAIEGTIPWDSGLWVRDGMKVLAKWGAPYETEWPYNIRRFTWKPPTTAYKKALNDIALEYRAVQPNLNALKAALAAGNPIVGGFSVFSSFVSDYVARTGLMPMPKKGEARLGGHCVTFDAFSDSDQTFWCANSWGTDWGIGGWFKMPYANLSNCADFWVLTKVK